MRSSFALSKLYFSIISSFFLFASRCLSKSSLLVDIVAGASSIATVNRHSRILGSNWWKIPFILFPLTENRQK